MSCCCCNNNNDDEEPIITIEGNMSIADKDGFRRAWASIWVGGEQVYKVEKKVSRYDYGNDAYVECRTKLADVFRTLLNEDTE